MPLTLDGVRTILRTHFDTEWPAARNAAFGAETIVVAYQNEPKPASYSETWLWLGVLFGAATLPFVVPADTMRMQGVVEIQVHTKLGTTLGARKAAQVYDALTPVYKARNLQGIQFRVPTLVPVGHDPAYGTWRENISAPFWFHSDQSSV